MSCVETATRFRLLDGNVGWDHAESDSATHGVAGMHDDAGLRLETVDRERIGSDRLSPYMPPPWLAQGCGPCQWYLLTPGSCEPQVSRAQRCDEAAAPNTLGPGVLRRDPCNGLWTEVFPPPASDVQLRRPVAIAVRGSRLAVADEAAGKVFVWSIPDRRLGAVIDVEAPTAVAFAPWGDLLVAISAEVAARTPKQSTPNSSPPDTQVNVARFSPTGEPRGRILFDAKGPFSAWQQAAIAPCGSRSAIPSGRLIFIALC